LSVVDAVVSPLSTIILEAAIHGKPVLCFLPEEESEARHFQMVAPMIHFEDMYRMPQFLKARSLGQLVPSVEELLSKVGDRAFARELEKACSVFVEPFERSYSQRLNDFVSQLVPVQLEQQKPHQAPV
jgi:CDP-glycerol glycerophosphotransferase (TagB/SpsB family)